MSFSVVELNLHISDFSFHWNIIFFFIWTILSWSYDVRKHGPFGCWHSDLLIFLDFVFRFSQKKLSRDGYFQFVYEEGKNAAKEKDYSEAVKWFSEVIFLLVFPIFVWYTKIQFIFICSTLGRWQAIYLQPNNETLLSNRSICWANLDEPNFSLHDAEACVMLKPDWPKGHYRAGVAWMLLKVCKILHSSVCLVKIS